ncbi:MAG: hypothetical protein RSB59_06290 [Clostridia bacterium]
MLNDLYCYPVEVNDVDIQNYTGIEITDDNRQTLIDAHCYIYDVLIYPTFNADIKNRIIEKYKAQLEKPIKRAIVEQFKYMYVQGDIGAWNGTLQGDSNSVDSKEQQEILTKMLAPKVINILKGAAVDILYAGG